MIIKIPYRPRQWARQLHESRCRWIVCILHRRAGKTVAALNHLQRDALRIPNSRFAYIAPTYKQAKDIAWDQFKLYARPIPGVQFNESELRVDYPNGARVRLYGADNPDSLRGIALWGVVFDEYSQQPSNIFGEIISKALADHYGYAIWIGTVKGKNHLYQMYKNTNGAADWLRLWQDIDKSLASEEGETINNLRKALADDWDLVRQGIMTEEELKQEWYLSVDAPVKGAVYASEWSELVKNGRLLPLKYDPLLPTYSSWDFGIGDATALGIYQIGRGQLTRDVRLVDYHEATDQALPYYLDWLKSKPYKLTMSYGDPSGQNRQLNTGKSIFEDLNSDKTTKYLGYPMRMFARRTQVIDKIHSVKKILKYLYVDESLTPFTDAITNYHYQWDESRGEFKPEPFHDKWSHAMDQLGYFAVNYLVPVTLDPVQEKIRKLQVQNHDLSNDFYSQ